MMLSLILLGLLAGVALRQGSQGFFGALIMAVLTICCAAAAVGTHEYVTNQWLASWLEGWNRDYAFPLSLAAIFGIPLLLLRLLFDRLISRACLLPGWVDRIGSGVCGLVIAVVMVGMLALCLQMIPFTNGSVIGFSRVAVVDPREQSGETPPDEGEADLCFGLSPDRFTVGFVSALSSGIFSGSSDFYAHHPDFVQSLGWVNSVHAEVSHYAPPGSLSIVRTVSVDSVFRYTQGNERRNEPPVYDPVSPQSRHVFRMMRVKLSNEARDSRKSHVFALRQFRLVGRNGADGHYAQYYPIAVQQPDADQPLNRHLRASKKGAQFWPATQQRYSPRMDNKDEVEIVFEIPTDFKPVFLEYKHEARVAVKFDRTRATTTATESPGGATSTTVATAAGDSDGDSTPGSSRRRGRPGTADSGGSGARARAVSTSSGSRFSEELPMTMRSYRQFKDTQIKGNRLAQGHLVGNSNDQSGGSDPEVVRFDVPSDKRLLQLSTTALQARSGLGRALSKAITTVQNYTVEDSNGKRYLMIGKYAVAKVRRRNIVEVQYFPEPTGSIGALGPFDRIKEQKLTADDTYVLLFLVDPGVQIVRFSTGGAVGAADNLTSENLIAPQ